MDQIKELIEAPVPENATRFYIYRHGETDWNKQKRLQGLRDIPLNSTGIQQAEDAGTFLRSCGGSAEIFDAVVSSPLQRCRDTAERIAQAIGFSSARIVTEVDIQEWSAGDLEGERLDELQVKVPDICSISKGKRNIYFKKYNVEQLCTRGTRVVAAVNRAARRFPGQKVLMVAHAGVLDDIFRRANYIPAAAAQRVVKQHAGLHVIQVYALGDFACIPTGEWQQLPQTHLLLGLLEMRLRKERPLGAEQLPPGGTLLDSENGQWAWQCMYWESGMNKEDLQGLRERRIASLAQSLASGRAENDDEGSVHPSGQGVTRQKLSPKLDPHFPNLDNTQQFVYLETKSITPTASTETTTPHASNCV